MIEQKICRQRGGAGAALALQQTIEDDRALGHLALNHESHCLMFCSMCRHDGPMTIAVEIGSVESACCPPAIFSPLRSSVSAPPSIRRCAACSILRCRHY